MQNDIQTINKNLDDLNNNYNNKINRVLISLCNINDSMAIKPNTTSYIAIRSYTKWLHLLHS